MDNSSSNSCSPWDLEIMSMGGNPFHLDPRHSPLDFIQQQAPAALHQPPSLHPAPAPARVELGGEGEEKGEEEGEEEEDEEEEEEEEALGAMKEMMYRIAAMQPVDIDPASIKKPRRRNVRISEEPQSVAARLRRERISERMRILQRLVPGGTKMDTASMLDEAIRYVKFLKRQVLQLQAAGAPPLPLSLPPPPPQPLPPPLLHARASSSSSSSLSRFGAFHDHDDDHHHPML